MPGTLFPFQASMTIQVRALRSFEHEGRSIQAGEVVSMAPLQAAVHGRRQNVSLAPLPATRGLPEDQTEESTATVPPRRRRAYRRRDLVAETE